MKFEYLNLVGRGKTKSFLDKAKSAQRSGRWAEAYEAYRMILKKDDRRFGVLVQMGHMSKEMENFSQAEAHYAEALTLKPQDWDLHVQFGHLYNRLGDLAKAKDWYKRANGIHPTVEISELLDTVGDAQYANDTGALRKKTLEQMDSRRFHLALPNAKLLYEQHGLRDFDVILGHAYRELGRYEEAKEMYGYYFDRCLKSNSKHLNDASWHLMNILEISEENQEILKLFSRLKNHYAEAGNFSDFDGERAELLQSHIGKSYGVFRG